MKPPLSSDEEAKRLAALDRYTILDSLPEQDYEDITQLAAQICGTPVALITLVDSQRQWFKSNRGLSFRQTPREDSFCAHNLTSPVRPLIVPDARQDERFRYNPLVTGDPHIVFYAGEPLVDQDGYTLGCLCVIDSQVRQLDAGQLTALKILTRQVVTLLTARQKSIQQTLLRQQLDRSETRFENLVLASPAATAIFTGRQMTIQQVNAPMLAIWGKDASVIGKTLHQALPELEGQPFLALLQRVFDTGEPYQSGQGMAELIQNGQPKRVWFVHAYKPLYDGGGHIYGVINTATDITEQVLTQQAIARSQQDLLALFEQSPVAIAILSKDGLVFQTANAFYGYLVGRQPDELIGKPLLEALPELAGQGFDQLLKEVIATGQPFVAPEVRVELVRNGQLETLYVNLTYQPQRATTGTISGILVVATDVTAQVVARRELEASEAHLQLLRDTVPAMIFYLDAQQRYQSYNQVFKEWYQVGEEALGQTVRELAGEQAYQTIEPHLTKAYGGQVEQYELLAPARMGPDRWLSIVYTPHKTPEGRVMGVIVHATDITQRKQSERILQASEARFRSLIQEAPVATCLFVGRELRIEVVNEMMLGLWGKDHSVLHKPLAEAVPELKGQPFLSILDEIFTTGQAYSAQDARAELVVDGVLGTYYFDFTYKPLRNAAGEVYAIMDMATDVTQQVLARQQLLESQAALQNAVELAELGTWRVDVQTGVTQLSPRHAEMFGLTQTLLSYEQALAIVHPDDREQVGAAFRTAMQPGSLGQYAAEYRIINARSGQQQHIRARGETSFDQQGTPLRIMGMTQDVTLERESQQLLEAQVQQRTQELIVANQDLKRFNDNLQQFAYVASHDLQEPLRKIQAFSTLLEQQLAGQLTQDSQRYLERISLAGARMSTLIKDLLAYSRISTRQQTFGLVSLEAILDQVRSTLEWTITERSAQIDADELPVVRGDESQLSQLFQNLLSNALKFTPAGQSPQIRIQCFQRERHELPARVHPLSEAPRFVQISIGDQGIGFEEKYLDRIFQVFQRLHGKNEFAGTGVGLAICQKVVENHGGAITADSQPGKGATFCVYLPA